MWGARGKWRAARKIRREGDEKDDLEDGQGRLELEIALRRHRLDNAETRKGILLLENTLPWCQLLGI